MVGSDVDDVDGASHPNTSRAGGLGGSGMRERQRQRERRSVGGRGWRRRAREGEQLREEQKQLIMTGVIHVQ